MNWKSQSISHASRLEALRAQDPYKVLGIQKGANGEALKEAYYKLMEVYYPAAVDPFMRPYCEELIKIINRCLEEVKGAINGN